jgi:hypothetical protein
MIIRYTVEVEVERESGLFVGRDEISEKLTEAINEGLDAADLSGLGANADSEYNVTNVEINEEEK